MEKRTSGNPQAMLVNILMLALAGAGGFFWTRQRLESSRPGDGAFSGQRGVGDEEMPSRLWRDPLSVAAEYLATTTKRGEASDGKASVALPPSAHKDARPVLVMPILTRAGFYEDDIEFRTRSRYAVVHGLSASGYHASDAMHLGLARLTLTKWCTCLTDDPETCQTSKEPTVCTEAFSVAYEWYTADDTTGEEPDDGANAPAEYVPPAYQMVLVLWIPEAWVGGRPLTATSLLISDLVADWKKPPTLHVRVVGPPSSNGLSAVTKELRKKPPTSSEDRIPDEGKAPVPPLREWQVMSPWATAPEHFFDEEGGAKPERLHRISGTDDHLAAGLVRELVLRGVHPFPPKCGSSNPNGDHVVLIAEADTVYGRSLPDTFVAALNVLGSVAPSVLKDWNGVPGTTPWEITSADYPRAPSMYPPNVRLFTYLRGVDGRREAGADGEQKTPGSSPGVAGKDERARLRRPAGTAQYDYIRRLAERIAREAECSKPVRTIGILGTDEYDKLLLLQALRPVFPTAVFFTTDLDTRLTHPDEYQSTHGLVMAAHYGLQLDDAGYWERDEASVSPREDASEVNTAVPPFRESYQTATFSATRAAVVDPATPVGQYMNPPIGVYEIGRDGAVQLNKVRTSDNLGVELGMCAAVFVLAIACVRTVRHLANPRRQSLTVPEWTGYTAVLIVALVAFLAFRRAAMASHIGPSGEPFLWVQGVSVWPSYLLRLLAAVLAALFLVDGMRRLRCNVEDLSGQHGLSVWRPPGGGRQGDGVGTWVRHTLWPLKVDHVPGDGVDANALWIVYQIKGRSGRRILRTVGLTVVYVVVVAGILLCLRACGVQPAADALARGGSARSWQFPILGAAIVLMWLLIFFVVDATLLCIQFVSRLSQDHSRWSTKRRGGTVAPRSDHDCEYLDLQIIGERTRVVQAPTYAALVVIALIVGSRSGYFDNWAFPPVIAFFVGLAVSTVILSALFLRWAAERARALAVTRLTEMRLQLPPGSREGSDIVFALERAEQYRVGALAPWSQQPIIQAILLPSGGLGAWALLNAFVFTG